MTIKVAVAQLGNDALDPTMEVGDVNRDLNLPLWDTLLDIGPDSSVVPGVAERWETSEDGLTWTFHLREGIQFHDGWGELTAADVKFSLERWADEAVTSDSGAVIRSAVDRVEVVDDYTVEIHTKGVQTGLPLILSPHQSMGGVIFSSEYLLQEAGPDFAAQRELLERHPIGSGPFKFVSREVGVSRTFEVVRDHWRAQPAFDRLELILVSEPATQMALLRSGDVDIITITGDQIPQVEDAGFEVRAVTDGLHVELHINGTYRPSAEGKPASDPKVRKALSLAIDRESILGDRLAGTGNLPVMPYNTSPATQDMDVEHFADWAAEKARYDPDEARRLLAEAGYPDGIDDITLYTFPRPNVAFMPEIAEIIAAQWAEVGINAKLELVDYATYTQHYVRAPLEDSYNAADANTMSTGTRFDSLGALNIVARYDNGVVQLTNIPELDGILDQIAAEQDDAKRKELSHQAWDIFNEQNVIIELFTLDSLYVVSDKVAEWQQRPGWPYLGRVYETIGHAA